MAEEVVKLSPIRTTPIDAALVALAAGQTTLSPQEAWFGPANPLPAVAPKGTEGREFDYGFAANLNYRPRTEPGENSIDFPTLEALADPTQGGFGLLRLVIETCKNQMAGQKWAIQPRDENDTSKKAQDRAKEITDMVRQPDGRMMFSRWRRKILEDHLVIDHPMLYRRPTARKGIYLPEVISGATMKLVIDAGGRMPTDPKAPAFQQTLKGVPAVTYTTDQIIYAPFNSLPRRAYAYGPVEQFVDVINFALRRNTSLLQYYTEGSVPDAFLSGPPDWNPQQVKEFQLILDSLLAGDTARRRKVRVIPNATSFTQVKEPDLKTAVDEWVARITCWCFSVSPSMLVKDNNRATANTAKQTAQEEGLEPRKEWFKELMDLVIATCYDAPDMEFVYRDEEIVDPLTKAQVIQISLGGPGNGWITKDEARDMSGLAPATADQKAELLPPPPPPPAPNPGEAPAAPPEPGSAPPSPEPKAPATEPPPAEKLAKARKAPKRDRPLAKSTGRGLSTMMSKRFGQQKEAALSSLGRMGKADLDDYTDLWDSIRDPKATKAAKAEAEAWLSDLAVDGADFGLHQVVNEPTEDMLNQANEGAIDWAEEHAAELIDGIDDTTAEGLRGLITGALEDGASNSELADRIAAFTGFDDARAERIARTETANADVAGNLEGWRASGVVTGKRWLPDSDPCPECKENADKGVIGLDEDFPSGDDGPAAHPNCECDLEPVVGEEDS